MAFAFPLLAGRSDSGIRRRVYGRYLIFYRVEEDTVQILHVLHGAMDYEAILFPED
jgi:plasmid stabilization system protein ParE